jgi:hypothetical protein
LKKYYLIFLSLILLTNCQKENIDKEPLDQTQSQNAFLEVRKIGIGDANDELQPIFKALKKVENKNLKYKGNGINDIEIVGEEGMLVSDGSDDFYTFQIKRGNSTLIENLIVKVQNGTKEKKYTTYIASYDLSPLDKINSEKGEHVDLASKMRIQPISLDNIGALVSQRSSERCYEIIEVIEKSRATGWDITVYKIIEVTCSGGGGDDDNGESNPANPADDGVDNQFPENGFGGGNESGGPGPNNPAEIDFNDTGIYTAPILRLNIIGELGELLQLGPHTTPQMQYLLNDASTDQVVDLYNYVEEEQRSNEVKNFAKAAIDAWMEDGEVDFVEQIIIDNDFLNTSCLKSVYDDMGKVAKFKEYLQNFEPSGSLATLRFTADNNFGNNNQDYTNAMAITIPPLSSNEIIIAFNTDSNTSGNILDKPDVFKAVAMIHELLHVEMFRKMLDAVRAAEISGNNLNWANWTNEQFYYDFLDSLENKYFGIFDYFTRYKYGIPVSNEPNDWQHQQMAQHYRNTIKKVLTDYDPTLTIAQKEALSWIGLNEANIKAWQNLDEDPNLDTQQEQNAITTLISQIKNTFTNECN